MSRELIAQRYVRSGLVVTRGSLIVSRYAAATAIPAVCMVILTSCARPDRVFDPGQYPPVRRGDTVDVLHGVEVADPYRWLEDEESNETQAWVEAQNTLTHTTLGRFAELQGQIAAELEAVYGVDSASNLFPHKGRYFFMRRSGLENHSKLYVCDKDYRAEPRVALDPNTFSEDGTVAMDWWFPSPDGSLIAYGKSSGGSEKSTLHIRDVKAGTNLPDAIPFTQYCSVAWNASGTGFYYNRSPDPATVPPGEENFHMRVYYHIVGSDYQQDRYVWGKGRPIDEEPRPYSSSDHKYVLLNFFRDPAKNDLYFGLADSTRPLRPVAVGLEAITTGDVVDGRLILRTNYDAPRYRICTAPVDNPTPEHWQELIPEQKGVVDDFAIVDGKLVVHLSEDVHSRLLVYDLSGKFIEEVPLPGVGTVTSYVPGVGTITSFSGSMDGPGLFFSFSSWVVPTATYRYDLRTHELVKLFETTCPIDLSKYETKQIWFASKDGTRVPMFVVAGKDVKLDGNNPTLLYGYGGFNSSFFPFYRPRIIPFLERGGVWVLANIRGGGELGQDWHDGGRREHKQNCFDDFYAAGEKLIELGYTNPRKLACKGGSNGGLLIGAAITQRPDLFQAALSQVPLMDMLRFHQWGMGAQWVHEYGNPKDPTECQWLRAYSPYHNVRDGVDYPATLIVTAEADNRVDTAHAFKMTARLQEATSGTRPILLRVERKAGHGAGKPLSMKIENQSEDWAFLMWQLGMVD
ncbi:MAG: prolyl oligopeptidase family serine peptidase [Planctomycetes bacterium]|nr:prolyl oligopeptidase family serine peptidase [Planctomycetota bacterium]